MAHYNGDTEVLVIPANIGVSPGCKPIECGMTLRREGIEQVMRLRVSE